MTDNLLKCITIEKVEETFKSISHQGCLLSVTSTVGVDTDGHSQGSNYYVDKNGKKYFIVSHDDQKNKKNGNLIIFKELHSNVEPVIVSTPAGFNHPGSFQIVGDYLFLPVENYKATGSDPNIQSMVCVYDLSPLAEGNEPVLLKKSINTFTGHKAGMLGVTDEWLAIHDNANFYLYKIVSFTSDGTLKLESYNGKEAYTLDNFQGIGLVKASDGVLYLIGLCSDFEAIATFKDRILLYRIYTDSSKLSFDAVKKAEYHVSTDHGRGTGGALSIHFRYGGGVYLEEGTITCIGTGRNINKKDAFNYNTFSNVDRLKINCRQKPLEGQGSRCSQNFSLKGFEKRSKKVKFTIMKNGAPCDKNYIINVAKDVVGTDPGIYSKICNVEDESKGTRNTFDLSTESPLYFFYNSDFKQRTNDSLIVVIEGTN
ncbi:MAG: hypothetical protein LUC97_09385 [Clostridiales bacterium]|nr:hypothetical protein [Clostridiales bacterium]